MRLTWTPVNGSAGYRLTYGAEGDKTLDVTAGTTSHTFARNAQGTLVVTPILGAPTLSSSPSNGVAYESFDEASCG